jgi:phage terminase large subunit GpA-like protein
VTIPSETAALVKQALALFEPPPDVCVWEWAEQYRRMGKDVTAVPGRYRVESAPYQKEPQESFTAQDVQTTVLMWASRLGKTELLNNLEGHTIDVNPRGVLVVYPTLDSAKKWSKEFFTPMIRATPKLRDKIKDSRSRDANNTILSKQFPGGKISAIGSNSPSGFRQIQAPVVICDEIDAMENGTEGDPIALAFRRADNYRDSVQVLSSTPTVKGASRIEKWYEVSDKQQWFCPCPACGERQVWQWSQVEWPEGRPDLARIKCDRCSVRLNDEQRRESIRQGEWRATAKFQGIRGYWLNGLNTLFPAKKGFANRLHQMVVEAVKAREDGEAAMQAWTNTFLAETYEPPSDKVETASVMQRAEPYGGDDTIPILPRYVLALTAAVDVQSDRLEVEVCGWGLKDECWGVEFRRLPGDPTRDEVWERLDELLATEYRHECGGVLRISRAAIDTGFKIDRVCAYVRTRQPRVFALKGSSERGALPLQIMPKINKQGVRLYMVGTDANKDAIYSRLQLKEPGPRYFHWPTGFGYDAAYYEQLTAEQRRTVLHNGFPRSEWFLPAGKRNEALDLRVYNLAAWDAHKYHVRPNLEKLARQMEARSAEAKPEAKTEAKVYELKPAPETKPEEKAEPPKVEAKLQRPARPFVASRRGGFATRW